LIANAIRNTYTVLSQQFQKSWQLSHDDIFTLQHIAIIHNKRIKMYIFITENCFLPRDASHSAVMRLHVVRPSVRPWRSGTVIK